MLQRWNALSDCDRFWNDIDRLFSECANRPRSAFPVSGFRPAIDLYDADDQLVVKALIPGARASDLQPNAIRRKGVKMDNLALIPRNLLPYKGEYQEIANGLPKDGILIVLLQELKQRRAFEQTAALLKQQGKRI